MRNPIVRAVIEVTIFWWLALPVFAVLIDNEMFYEVATGLSEFSPALLLHFLAVVVVSVALTMLYQYWQRTTRLKQLVPTSKDFISSTIGSPLLGKTPYAPVAPPVLPECQGVDYSRIRVWVTQVQSIPSDRNYLAMAQFLLGYYALHQAEPASYSGESHRNRTLLEHCLLVADRMMASAATFKYQGVKDGNGQVLIEPRDPAFKLNPDDPMIFLVGLAHDIGKVDDYVRDENGKPIGSNGRHSQLGARLLGRQFQYRQLPFVDGHLLVTALQFYHHPHATPVEEDGKAFDDRAMAIMQLLIESDFAAAEYEKQTPRQAPTSCVEIENLTPPSLWRRRRDAITRWMRFKQTSGTCTQRAEAFDLPHEAEEVAKAQCANQSNNANIADIAVDVEPAEPTRSVGLAGKAVRQEERDPTVLDQVAMAGIIEQIDLVGAVQALLIEAGRVNDTKDDLNIGVRLKDTKYGDLLVLKKDALVLHLSHKLVVDSGGELAGPTCFSHEANRYLLKAVLEAFDRAGVLFRGEIHKGSAAEDVGFDVLFVNQKTGQTKPGREFVFKKSVIVCLADEKLAAVASIRPAYTKISEILDEGESDRTAKPSNEKEKSLLSGQTKFEKLALPTACDGKKRDSSKTASAIKAVTKPSDTLPVVSIDTNALLDISDLDDPVAAPLEECSKEEFIESNRGKLMEAATLLPKMEESQIENSTPTADVDCSDCDTLSYSTCENVNHSILSSDIKLTYSDTRKDHVTLNVDKEIYDLLRCAGVSGELIYQESFTAVSETGFCVERLAEEKLKILKALKQSGILRIVDGKISWPSDLTSELPIERMGENWHLIKSAQVNEVMMFALNGVGVALHK